VKSGPAEHLGWSRCSAGNTKVGGLSSQSNHPTPCACWTSNPTTAATSPSAIAGTRSRSPSPASGRSTSGQTWPRVYRDNPDATVLTLVVIGALPPGALSVNPELDPDTDLLVLSSNRFDQASADDRWFAPILRLKPGVSLTAAQSALDLALTTAPGRRAADGRPVHGVRLETLRR